MRKIKIVPPVCPLCGATARYIDSVAVYGTSFGMMWLCPTPRCDSYVGAHADGRPKGTLAGPELRKARRDAHAAFDGWWQRAHISRTKAYITLSRVLGIDDAHIGSMDIPQCEFVVAIFTANPIRDRETPNQYVRRLAARNSTLSTHAVRAGTEIR